MLRDKDKQLLAARTAREKEWTQTAAGRMSLAKEFGQVNAKLERLRAICANTASDRIDLA